MTKLGANDICCNEENIHTERENKRVQGNAVSHSHTHILYNFNLKMDCLLLTLSLSLSVSTKINGKKNVFFTLVLPRG